MQRSLARHVHACAVVAALLAGCLGGAPALAGAAEDIDAGLVARSADRLDLAEAYFTRSLHRFDASASLIARALNNRGVVRRRLDQPRAAEADFDRALAIDFSLAPAYFNRGMLYMNEQRLAEGVTDLSRYLAYEPRNALALYARGLGRWRLGDRPGGRSDIEQAFQLRPDHPTIARGFRELTQQ